MQKISKPTLITSAILALATVFALALAPISVAIETGEELDLTDHPYARALADDDYEDIVPTGNDLEGIEPISSELAESTGAENDDNDLSWIMWAGGATIILIIAIIVFAIVKNKKK